MKDKSKRLIPDSEVCRRYGVVPYTLYRWDRNPDFDFPKPVRINGRKYRVEDELDKFDAQRAAERDARSVDDHKKHSNEPPLLDAGEAA
jgi:predicted DNA-binding transcriptional regulator AlpA